MGSCLRLLLLASLVFPASGSADQFHPDYYQCNSCETYLALEECPESLAASACEMAEGGKQWGDFLVGKAAESLGKAKEEFASAIPGVGDAAQEGVQQTACAAGTAYEGAAAGTVLAGITLSLTVAKAIEGTPKEGEGNAYLKEANHFYSIAQQWARVCEHCCKRIKKKTRRYRVEIPKSDKKLSSLELRTASGTASVYVPAKGLYPGATFSGTVVVAEKVKRDKDERMLELVDGERRTPLFALKNGAGGFTAVIPADLDPENTLLVLREGDGTVIARAQLAILALVTGADQLPATAPPPPEFRIPRIIQRADSTVIIGAFDGRSTDTAIEIGTARLPVLAESPVLAVLAVPPAGSGAPTDSLGGLAAVTVREGDQVVATAIVNVVDIQLSGTERLTLGAPGTLHVRSPACSSWTSRFGYAW